MPGILDIFSRVREQKGFAQDVTALQRFQQQKQQLAAFRALPLAQRQGFVGPIIAPQFPQPQSQAGAALFSEFLLQRQQIRGRPTAPPTIAGLRAAEAMGAGARPGTPEFERIATGPMQPTQKAAQAKLDAYNKAKAVSPVERTKHQQAVVEEYEIGQALVQINLGKASPTERTKIAETRASIDALNNIKELYDDAKTRTGPFVGRVDPILGLFGWTTNEQEDFMAATSAFRNKIIEEITGAQMSEVEAKRILKQVPQETDPPARWEAKWKQSKKNLEFLQKRRLEILRQSGLQAPGGQTDIRDTQGRQPTIPSQLQSVPFTQEDIEAELQRRGAIK